jgi:hypothetical protein
MLSQLAVYTPDSSIGAIDDLTDVRTICLEVDTCSYRKLTLYAWQRYLSASHQATAYATSDCILNCEVDVIVKAIGGG